MITELKIKLIFLRLLSREPSLIEIDESKLLGSERNVTDAIMGSEEYLNSNKVNYMQVSYDKTNEQISIQSARKQSTFVIGSEALEIQATSQYNVTSHTTYHDGFFNEKVFSLCDVRIFTTDYELNSEISQTTHILDTRRCVLIDNGTIRFNRNETIIAPTITFSCEKRCLQHYPSCFMQSFSIISDMSTSLPIFHCIEKSSTNIRKFETFLPFNSNNSNVFYSKVVDKFIDSTHVIYFNNLTNVIHSGVDNITDDTNVLNQFIVQVEKDVPLQFHIVSFISSYGSSTSRHGMSILAGIINEPIQSVINEHEERWLLSWRTNIDVSYKTHITNVDMRELSKFMAIIKYGLFSAYSGPPKEDLLNLVPLLTITNQNKLKTTLDTFLKDEKYNSRGELTTLYGKQGSYFKYNPYSTTSNEELNHRFIKYIFKTALVNIAIWNYFRTTKDKTWLILTGFPAMKENADFLCEHIDHLGNVLSIRSLNDYDQDNNSFTNTVVYLALNYTNQVIYELNYIDNNTYETCMRSIKKKLMPLETIPISKKIIVIDYDSVYIFVEKLNGLYTYVFYKDASKSERIGYQLGGNNGFFVDLKSVITVFYVDSSVVQFPISFYNNIGDGTQIRIPQNRNCVIIDAMVHRIVSYKYIGATNQSAYLHVDFDTSFGYSAFYCTYALPSGVPNTNFSDVIKLHDNIDWSQNIYVNETLLLFSELFEFENLFVNGNDTTIDNIVSTIKDNIELYRTSVLNTTNNAQLDAITQSYLAQREETYASKKIAISSFFNHTIETVNLFDRNQLYPVVYAVISNLGGITVSGTISQSRHVLEEYGLKMKQHNVFPKSIMTFTFKGFLNSQQNDTITNAIYNDNPLLSILNHKTIQFIIKDSSCIVKVVLSQHLDHSEYIYEIQLLNNFETSLVQENECEHEFSFVLPLIDLTSDYEIEELQEITLHIRVLRGSDIVSEHTDVYTNIVDTVTEINLQPPFIKAAIDYPTLNPEHVLLLKMEDLIPLENTTLRSIKYFKVSIHYDNRFIKSPIFNPSENSLWLVTETITNNNILLEFNKNTPSTSIPNIGHISFTMDLVYISMLYNSYTPLSGELTIQLLDSRELTRPLRMNSDVFPPILYKQSRNYGFVYEIYDLHPFETDFVNSYITRNVFVETNADDASQLNALVNTDIVIKQIYVSESNTIVKLSTNEFLGKGPNVNNILMMSEELVDILEYTPCTLLNPIQNIMDIHITKSFALVRTTDAILGIGLNTDHNLGTSFRDTESDEQIHTTSLITCDLLQEMIDPSNMNDLIVVGTFFDETLVRDVSFTVIYKSTINKVFVIGCNPLFAYATSIGKEECITDVLVELTLVNEFLVNQEGVIEYTVKAIDIGDHCFKFLLENQNTLDTEWWGFGQNRYGSLGIEIDSIDSIQNPIEYKQMTRLIMIELLRFGRHYDPTYTGLSVFNPNKFYLVLNDGSSSNQHITAFDTLTKEIYILGKMNDTQHYEAWTKYDYTDPSSVNYIKTVKNGLLLGTNESVS
jgi:hypothetical protein